MKIYTYIIAIAILLSSCSKPNSQPKPDEPNSVTIDGGHYATVKIGKQTWMAVNYNGTGGVNYDESAINNPQYGKLYTYQEALAIKLPTGWRLPIPDDFYKIINSYIGKAEPLLALTGWNDKVGTNITGFNAFPAGYRSENFTAGKYGRIGDETAFITASMFDNSSEPICFVLLASHGSAGYYGSNTVTAPTDRASIRFVKDE